MKPAPPTLLIVRPGSVYPEIAAAHGDFEAWFQAALGHHATAATVVDPIFDELPDAREFDGCILTGSLTSVLDSPSWLTGLADWVRDTVAANRPLLGVCYGHQLIARALGGTVERSPHRRVFGVVEVDCTDAAARHPVLAGMPPHFLATFSHHDHVTRLPRGAQRLASTQPVRNAAFSIGSATGVQFHPEMTCAAREAIRSLDTGTPIGWPGQDAETPFASRILENFARFCVGRA